jgi:hypothetical protein
MNSSDGSFFKPFKTFAISGLSDILENTCMQKPTYFEISEDDHPLNIVGHPRPRSLMNFRLSLKALAFVSPGVNSRAELVPSPRACARNGAPRRWHRIQISNRRATQRCNVSAFFYAKICSLLARRRSSQLVQRVYWPENVIDWLGKWRPTCVMRHARGQKLQSFRRKWPFYMDIYSMPLARGKHSSCALVFYI